MTSAKVIFNNKSAIEHDIHHIMFSNKPCSCGNPMRVPLVARVLGLVDSCSHCDKDYPMEQHCKAVLDSYKSLIEDGGVINLD